MDQSARQPSVASTAFDCPHCGAFTTQYWYDLYAKRVSSDSQLPSVPNERFLRIIEKDLGIPNDAKEFQIAWIKKFLSKQVFLEELQSHEYARLEAKNLHLSACYNCKKISVWVHEKLVFPKIRLGVEPNSDLPEEILPIYREAQGVLNDSPRGSAALLRLCVQMLCKRLGENGKSIDDDIASLVGKGLNPLVQRSLDIVRVIGNEAVHPGTIDLNDNRDIADQLFGLVNAIVDQMISHPKNVNKLYERLPSEKRQAIEKRNEKALKNP